MTIDELKRHLAKCEAEGRSGSDPGLTFVARTARGLGVRPELLAEHEDGQRVYQITVAQLRRLIVKAGA